MDRVGATNPFHISKAYGVSRPNATGAAAAAGASFKASIGQVGSATRSDSVDASTARVAAAKQRIGTLVAARVSEQPESSVTAGTNAMQARSTASPAQSGGAFPMYRHPADKNAAATAVNAGRVLDLNA